VNQLLPPDVAVTKIEEVPPTFHARFSARSKHYQYRVYTGPVVPPFSRPYVHHVSVPLNVALMRREAVALKSRHDFRAFARAKSATRGTVRAITEIHLTRRGRELQLDVEGNGFLHTMVRSIAGTLLDIGRGHLPQGTVHRMLQTGERRLAGTTAPPHGLTLVSVTYPVNVSRRRIYESIKHQIPNPKHQTSIKFPRPASRYRRGNLFGNWDVVLGNFARCST